MTPVRKHAGRTTITLTGLARRNDKDALMRVSVLLKDGGLTVSNNYQVGERLRPEMREQALNALSK